LDLIPADMVQSIEVNKVVTADMEGDAIGGSVNLVTRSKPHARRISGTVGSGYNFLSEKPMAIGSLVYADRFLNLNSSSKCNFQECSFDILFFQKKERNVFSLSL